MNNDLISRSALKEAIEEVQYTQEFCIEHRIDHSVSMQMLGMIINNAPTVEPQKIVIIPPELIEKLALNVVDIVGNIDWEKAIEAYKARPQGKWVVDENGFSKDFMKCSNCNEDAEWLDGGSPFLSNFCPNCGADMRGGRE